MCLYCIVRTLTPFSVGETNAALCVLTLCLIGHTPFFLAHIHSPLNNSRVIDRGAMINSFSTSLTRCEEILMDSSLKLYDT